MAIATTLVITCEVAERFERKAQATNERSLHRIKLEKKEFAGCKRRDLEMI